MDIPIDGLPNTDNLVIMKDECILDDKENDIDIIGAFETAMQLLD